MKLSTTQMPGYLRKKYNALYIKVNIKVTMAKNKSYKKFISKNEYTCMFKV